MESVIAIGVAAVMFLASAYLLVREEETKGKITYAYILVSFVVVMGITCTLLFYYTENPLLFNLKRIGLLTILWAVAYVDFRELRIPNSYIILGLVYRIVLIPFELLITGTQMRFGLLGEVAAAGALFLAAMLCKLCIKNSIGAGDIKLFVVMGLLLGMDGIWSAIFLTLILSFVIAVFVLVTRKKTRKDSIPFGPAIALGTYLSIFLTGM